jgi:hypothetical protein
VPKGGYTIETYVAGELTIKQQSEAIKISEEQMRVKRLQAQQDIELEDMKAAAARKRMIEDAKAEAEVMRIKRAAELELRTKHKADVVSNATPLPFIDIQHSNAITCCRRRFA